MTDLTLIDLINYLKRAGYDYISALTIAERVMRDGQVAINDNVWRFTAPGGNRDIL